MVKPSGIRVSTNNEMDYWNGTLDWTTGLSYNPFWDKLLCLFLHFSTYLATMDDCSIMTIVVYCSIFINGYLKIPNYLRCKSFVVFSGLIGNHTKLFSKVLLLFTSLRLA